MIRSNRRDFLRGVAGAAGVSAGLAMFPPAIRKALAIPAQRRTGTIEDVEHIVILMQENRSFDHYFGTRSGVRGFGDRFPIPVPDALGLKDKNVWYQLNDLPEQEPHLVAPFHLDTHASFDVMRVTGTPHTWPNAQQAWAGGRMNRWPRFKNDHALGYFTADDIPFQTAMADAFTLCDAYHCAFHGGTNPNRCFLWTGSNDPLQQGHGPVLTNDYDNLEHDPDGGYSWVTYCERLERAGVSWQIYQDMEDNFTDNSVAGFRKFREAVRGEPGSQEALLKRGLSTCDLDKLQADVLANVLPQVSWIVATAEGSEHPGPSSPAQGAEYTARVLEALTANPDVWGKTVLLVMFDENDGFFDHVPPPAAPSYLTWDKDPAKAVLAGASTVDTTGEYHELLADGVEEESQLPLHEPYGLGPRVPLYVLSPWSKGGWVSSQVFDHTSVIRFVEQRFGVHEPNISAWRRAVCGDLTSTLDFASPDHGEFYDQLPETTELAERARALPETTTPRTPALPALPVQAVGTRPSRALPYELHVSANPQPTATLFELRFGNSGGATAVFHVYDRKHLEQVPRRYTVEPAKKLEASWDTQADAGHYDLWVLGPNGFHRHFTGNRLASEPGSPEIEVCYDKRAGDVSVNLLNPTEVPRTFVLHANAYLDEGPWQLTVAPHAEVNHRWSLERLGHWYDFSVTVRGLPGFARRFAGRVETGADSISDPALGGEARGEQLQVG